MWLKKIQELHGDIL